jgi:23S rRNA pseudouridine2605 synthase
MAKYSSQGSGRRGGSRPTTGSSRNTGKSSAKGPRKDGPKFSSSKSDRPKRNFNKKDDSSDERSGDFKKKYSRPSSSEGKRFSSSKTDGPKRSYTRNEAPPRGRDNDSTKKFSRPSSFDSPKSDRPKRSYNKNEESPRPRSGDSTKKFSRSSSFDAPKSDRPKRSYNKNEETPRERGGDSTKKFSRSSSFERPKSDRPKRGYNKNEETPRGKDTGSSGKFSRSDSSERPRYSSKKSSDSGSFGNKKPYSNKKSSGFGAKRPFRKEDGSTPRRRDEGDSKAFSKPRYDDSRSESKGFSNKRPRNKEENVTENPAAIQSGKIRLNRYIANSGVCSRREADELITMGLIAVNGKVITELGYKVNPGDEVRYESRLLKAEKPVYILLNKPKGYLTTTNDPQERNTVMQLIGDRVRERIYPVGRLDRNTTGLLLLTNDGELAEKLMHPSYNVKKIYKVELDRPLTKGDFLKIQEGIKLEEGVAQVDDIAIVSEDGKTVGLELHIGWNRVVRRIFEALEYAVVKLDRSVYAGLDKKELSRGQWRFLRQEEIVRLKHYK